MDSIFSINLDSANGLNMSEINESERYHKIENIYDHLDCK